MPIWRHFTAKNDMRRCLLDLNFCRSVSQCQLDIVWPFVDYTHSFSAFKIHKIMKNAIFTAVYDFLRHEIISDDVCLSWIFAWVCLSTKWALLEHFLTRVNILECMYLKKMPFLRHFTGFYGVFLKKSQQNF